MKTITKVLIFFLIIAFGYLIFASNFPQETQQPVKQGNNTVVLNKPVEEKSASQETDKITGEVIQETEKQKDTPTDNITEDVIPEPEKEKDNPAQETKNIKIANWNLQIFGDTKASKPELMNTYTSIIDDYDIVFVQEIRDSDGSAFVNLCSMLTNYDCKVSSRAGRSTSKEQYGIIYKKGIKVDEIKDYNPDAQDRWERPPIEVLFDIEGYKLRVYNIHTKPEAVKSELASLESIVSTNGNSIILGDLNADCDYYNPANTELDSWNWVIGDQEDTTSSATDCTYDRIIIDADAYDEYSTSGVFKTGITKDISDHYLVWVELKIK